MVGRIYVESLKQITANKFSVSCARGEGHVFQTACFYSCREYEKAALILSSRISDGRKANEMDGIDASIDCTGCCQSSGNIIYSIHLESKLNIIESMYHNTISLFLLLLDTLLYKAWMSIPNIP